ncbi:uncharacterized protein LOC115886813 [Sitophilus oryzae]|uniref:Uncharacterized protein LOC115886813 n=1 Tax=Sitophilus oryzae TaxID=7048 RepID=A0A6J2YEY2_SITOR|nr:uncharacterized protein LOC115886813 [Sitophilus oryzae]
MQAMLQRHCARYIYVIPEGLKELMSDISREVLRSQPENIYMFIADYLDALMITRENARVAARLVESLTEMATTTATFLEETGMSREDVDNIVLSIHRTFKEFIDHDYPRRRSTGSSEVEEANIVHEVLYKANIDPEQAEMAARIIQQAYRRFKEREEHEKKLLAGLIDWRIAARSAIRLYRHTGVTNEEANRAATLIKAAYRGYYTRRMMKALATMDYENLFPMHLEVDDFDYAIEDGDEEYDQYRDYQRGLMEDDEDDGIERPKSVTINYNTVIPHVDFDTDLGDQTKASMKVSTTSSIVKHSMGYIISAAIAKVTEDVLPEQTDEIDETGDDVLQTEVEIKSEVEFEEQLDGPFEEKVKKDIEGEAGVEPEEQPEEQVKKQFEDQAGGQLKEQPEEQAESQPEI